MCVSDPPVGLCVSVLHANCPTGFVGNDDLCRPRLAAAARFKPAPIGSEIRKLQASYFPILKKRCWHEQQFAMFFFFHSKKFLSMFRKDQLNCIKIKIFKLFERTTHTMLPLNGLGTLIYVTNSEVNVWLFFHWRVSMESQSIGLPLEGGSEEKSDGNLIDTPTLDPMTHFGGTSFSFFGFVEKSKFFC